MNDSSTSQESLHDQFVAKENPHNSPMSKETIRSGNAMMIQNILQIPVQPYQDGKGVYRILEVRGRQSGQTRRTPLAVFQYNGKRYLIAPTRQRDWVHNLITAGECTLVTKAEQEQSKATLTLDDEAIAGVRAYMAQLPDWALAQFPLKADASDEEMRAKSEEFAVFRLS
jgi:deazaflavin-dependent oxidoreductase (nitroreductase family)